MTATPARASEAPASADEFILKIDKVGKWFGQFKVLDNIELAVRPGERIVICGPSGSGKSTLIRCVNQLEKFQEGEIVVDGIHLSKEGGDIHRIRQEVGMVFQQFNLFPHLTVKQNCMLAPMRVNKLSPAKAEEITRRYLDRVHILDQIDKFPAQLSGGQQQRVAIARALCMKPKMMLFDEPTSALDPEMVQEVLDTMIDLAKEGMTMLCVTHEMGFARNVADRVVFMSAGKIVESRPSAEFFSSPNHELTQKFLANILH